MRLLSVVGVKTGAGRRATIVQSYNSKTGGQIFRDIKRLSKTFFVLLISAVLIFLQIREFEPAVSLQNRLVDWCAPITKVLILPFQWFDNLRVHVKSKEAIIAENQALKLQNDYLVRQRQATYQTVEENEKLREALNVQSALVDDIVTVRVSHHTYDGYSTTFYLDAFQTEGVSKNDPVLSTSGNLVGRVIDVGPNHTRIMPLVDAASRVPVEIEGSHEHAVLAGRGGNTLLVTHIENLAAIKVGDRLVTSGAGGIFPQGIPVAQVSEMGSSIKAKPLGNMKDQEFVLVLIK